MSETAPAAPRLYREPANSHWHLKLEATQYVTEPPSSFGKASNKPSQTPPSFTRRLLAPIHSHT
jgi:hypothetical protein